MKNLTVDNNKKKKIISIYMFSTRLHLLRNWKSLSTEVYVKPTYVFRYMKLCVELYYIIGP